MKNLAEAGTNLDRMWGTWCFLLLKKMYGIIISIFWDVEYVFNKTKETKQIIYTLEIYYKHMYRVLNQTEDKHVAISWFWRKNTLQYLTVSSFSRNGRFLRHDFLQIEVRWSSHIKWSTQFLRRHGVITKNITNQLPPKSIVTIETVIILPETNISSNPESRCIPKGR